MNGRKKLIEKYKGYETIHNKLEFILVKQKKDANDMAKYFNMVGELNEDKRPIMTEVLVDLIDFLIGETLNRTIYESISTRDKDYAILLLKRKLTSDPLSTEVNISTRNKIIRELLLRLITDVKYIDDADHFNPTESIKEWLFIAQRYLEEYYCINGRYPSMLSEVFQSPSPAVRKKGFKTEKEYKNHKNLLSKLSEFPSKGSDSVTVDDGFGNVHLLLYQSFDVIYFICGLGSDGLFGTEDDIQPPYFPEIFSFPTKKCRESVK
jgi:hypothetical protein